MVKKLFSKMWKSSSQPRKQRKYVHNAPLHIRHKLVAATLSKELREQYSARSIPVRKDDFVTIMTGQFKGQTGKVTKVSLARTFTHVEGAAVKKADGTDSLYPIHPSNLMITKLNLDDKKRVAKLERLSKK